MTPWLPGLLGLAAVFGCHVSADTLPAPSIVPPVELPAAGPPPITGAGGERLFQLLYAGEQGDQSFALGQKTRIFGWLRIMELSAGELNALSVLTADVAAMAAAAEARRTEADAIERAAYEARYAEINAALVKPSTTDADLAALAAQLEAARAGVAAQSDPWTQHLSDLSALIRRIDPWYEILDRSKRERASAARFFLTRRAAPLSNPSAYAALTGMVWDSGDFSALHRTGRPASQYQLDLGGLWSMEALRSPPGAYLVKRQIQAILVMAVLEPAFPGALAEWTAATAPPTPPTDAAPAGP